MKKPLISIIIPAFNEEGSIEKTLISLKSQKTKVPYEIIVCDNNSTDNTYNIAKKYANKVMKEKKQGGVYARNAAFKKSSGKYLVHTDADTFFPDNFIQEAYKIFKAEKYAGFMCGNWDLYEGDELSMKIKSSVWGFLFSTFMKIQSKRNIVTLIGWCMCTPRRVFEKVGGFLPRLDYFEDLLYSYRIDYLGDFKYFPDIKVKSSSRRLKNGMINFFKYLEKRKAGIPELIYLMTRKKYAKPFEII
jgi:glycosyltransferase involved in cell wall biosynthesis